MLWMLKSFQLYKAHIKSYSREVWKNFAFDSNEDTFFTSTYYLRIYLFIKHGTATVMEHDLCQTLIHSIVLWTPQLLFVGFWAYKMSNLTFISNFFSFSREKGTMENPQSLDLKSLQVSKALQVEIGNCLKLQLLRPQSLQNPPDPSCRVYNLHGFLPR